MKVSAEKWTREDERNRQGVKKRIEKQEEERERETKRVAASRVVLYQLLEKGGGRETSYTDQSSQAGKK